VRQTSCMFPLSSTHTHTHACARSHTHTPSLLAWNDHAIVIHGGRNESGDVLGDCHLLDLKTWTWTSVGLSGDGCTTTRCAHCAVAVSDSRILCCGGFDGASVTGEIFCIDLEHIGDGGGRHVSGSVMSLSESLRNADVVARLSPAATSVRLEPASGEEAHTIHMCVVGGVSLQNLESEPDQCDVRVLL